MSGYHISERRKQSRVFAQIPIICEIIDPKDKSIRRKNVLSRDISSTGIYFEIDEVLALNTEINISFPLPNQGKVVHAKVKVTRIEVGMLPDKYGVGATFLELAPEDQDEIDKNLVEHLDINRLLAVAIEKGASDLHLLAEHPPVLRLYGEIETLEMAKLSSDDIPRLLYSIMSREQVRKFEQEKELDFAIQYDQFNRFRINVHRQRGFLEATLRVINTKIASFEDLNIPDVAKSLGRFKDGLVLIVGPTGSGKTTTIAAMVELINQERQGVIITLERPIEYVYANKNCIIKQREVGADTNSFSAALKSTLRQDPNVIVVGELDDAETVRTAIVAAEAGYLVIASFHAPNTVQAIDRLATMFPVENRRQVLFQLANCFRGMICQILIPCKDKQHRVLATEIMIANDAVKRILRSDELIHIPTIIQTGRNMSMQPMHDSIWRYFEKGLIDGETAEAFSNEFKRTSSR